MSTHSSEESKKELTIKVRPPKDELTFPDVGKPQPIGFYSINADRGFEPNDRQFRYVKLPEKFPLDLNAGLEMVIRKPESYYDETLDNLLKFLCDHYQRIFNPESGTGAVPEFITWRGILRLLMCTPYEHRFNWCLHVTRFNNIFYILKKDTVQDKHSRAQQTQQQKTFMYYGFKFEQYCLTKSPSREPDTSVPVNECEEFYLVFQTRLTDLNLLYAAVTDGVMSDVPVQLNYEQPDNLDSLKYVKFKVRQANLGTSQYRSFLYNKICNWWCQSFLVGIKDLYVGMRSQKGIVDKIEHMDVRSLPNLEGPKYWSPPVCTNFLLQFLLQLRAIMANENCPHTVYELNFDAKSARIAYECFRGKTSHSFIPDWYIDQVNINKEKQNVEENM